MALFNMETGGQKLPTWKECIEKDIDLVFFNENEHAEWHLVDGKNALIILEESAVRKRSSHWEAGAKQNFDTGLYVAHSILYIKSSAYGPKPKSGKQIVLDEGTDHRRTYTILKCEEWSGVFRMTLERVRQ